MIIGYLSWFERKLEQQMQEKEEVSYSQLEIGRTQVGERFSTQKKRQMLNQQYLWKILIFISIDIYFCVFLF